MSLENKFDEIKGSVKEGEGLAEQVVSKVKEAAEDAKDAVEGVIDSVKDKLK